MQKTFLKLMIFELVERLVRFHLLLESCSESLSRMAPALERSLRGELEKLTRELQTRQDWVNLLFGDGARTIVTGEDALVRSLYARLARLSRFPARLHLVEVQPETVLFLRDALPPEMHRDLGEPCVYLSAEGETSLFLEEDALPGVFLEPLSILQYGNPLAWAGLTHTYSRNLLEKSSDLEAFRRELTQAGAKSRRSTTAPPAIDLPREALDALLRHAINLRLLGPAYYFYVVTQAMLTDEPYFFSVVEPALFFGLNHQNFAHKTLVILHESCGSVATPFAQAERASSVRPLAEETLSLLFRAVEKTVGPKHAFQEKHLERAIQLRERLEQGILLSSTSLYPVEEVAETLERTRGQEDFSIYGPLSMMTEYPHTPREIVNAGWLHKMERAPVWLYSALTEPRAQGLESMMELLGYQERLLRKSIEVSEVHRALLCGI